jgi:hypothetical protein
MLELLPDAGAVFEIGDTLYLASDDVEPWILWLGIRLSNGN